VTQRRGDQDIGGHLGLGRTGRRPVRHEGLRQKRVVATPPAACGKCDSPLLYSEDGIRYGCRVCGENVFVGTE
jgi:hypothetical protein